MLWPLGAVQLAHAPTEQFWLVYEPESVVPLHVRVWLLQLLPHETDELWYAVTLEPLEIVPPQGSVQPHAATEQLEFPYEPERLPLLQVRVWLLQLLPHETDELW